MEKKCISRLLPLLNFFFKILLNILKSHEILSRVHKKVSCVHANVCICFICVFIFMGFMGSVCCHFEKINEKTLQYLLMTVIYTNYRAENSAVLFLYVKYGPKIYWEVWKMYCIIQYMLLWPNRG